jgi:hypothetical protein
MPRKRHIIRMSEAEMNPYRRRVVNKRFEGKRMIDYDSRKKSLKFIGKDLVEFRVTDPDTDSEYVFGIRYLHKAKYEALICVGDYTAFVIPTKVMREWGIKNNENSNSRMPTIKLTEDLGWVITFTKDEEALGDSIMPIGEYAVNFKEPDEIGKFDEKVMKIALAMQEIIGLRQK